MLKTELGKEECRIQKRKLIWAMAVTAGCTWWSVLITLVFTLACTQNKRDALPGQTVGTTGRALFVANW